MKWMNEWMNERMNEWMNARKRSEWMNARMNECSFDKGQPPLATTAATLPQKHRVSRPIVFSSLNSRVPNLLHVQTTWWWCGCHDVVDMMMWLANGNRALATVSCTFTDLIFQKGSETLRFFKNHFQVEIELLLQSRAQFANLIFQKSSGTFSFLTFLSGNRALATVSCTVCQPHLPKELRDLQFFNIFKWKSSSRYSLVHSLPTSSSKRAPGPSVF